MRLYSKIGRALVEAKESGGDPYVAIEKVLPWSEFERSVSETAQLAQPQTFDHLHLVGEQYGILLRYTPEFLDVLKLKAVLDAIDVLREMNATGSHKVPEDAATSFVKAGWEPLVFTDAGIDRRFHEICALSELKNALRSGGISVHGSRQFRDFDDYLLPPDKFRVLQKARTLPIAINPDLDQYLLERMLLLNQQLATVNRLALANELPDAIISDTGLKITPQDSVVPASAQTLIDQSSNLLPRIKITELLMDVDDWTGFTRHFVHLKSGAQVQDRTLRLSAILADAIDLGLTKMAESSPGANYAKLSWLQAWHICDETYSAGLADLVNVQFAPLRRPLGRWRHLVIGRTALSCWLPGRKHRPHRSQVRRRAGKDGLHPYFEHLRAVQHQDGQRRHARFNLCARRAASPRVGFAHLGAL